MQKYAHITCKHVGIAATTKIFIKATPTGREDWPYKYEARVGVAIFGQSHNQTDNPFDENFRDNYVSGKGMTEEKCMEELHKELANLSESLWA